MEYSVEKITKLMNDLDKRLSVVEAFIKFPKPNKKEECEMDERDQCMKCGEYCDTDVVHKCNW